MFAFIRETILNYHHAGAIAPSSAFLARALTDYLVERPEGPMHILEVGPGTGAVTGTILSRLRTGDTLTLCEINPAFVRVLEEKFAANPKWKPWRAAVQIICAPVEELSVERQFHHAVCGLPFNNFPPTIVDAIFSKLASLTSPRGTLSFFEYVFIRQLKMPFASSKERERLRAVAEILGHYIQNHQIRQKLVLPNLPPAWARTLRF